MNHFDEAVAAVEKLSPREKLALLKQIADSLEGVVEAPPPRQSLYGMMADLGTAPSAEEIDEARREMWENFPRDDI